MNPFQQLLLTMGIADVEAFTNFVIATSKVGPNFKAAAQNAVQALAALGVAAENPTA